MRKLLLLFFALLTSVSGAWAATAVTEVQDGRYYKLRFRFNCINWVKSDLTLDGGHATSSDPYINGDESNAGVFKFEKSGDVWYIKEVSSGKYVYATNNTKSSNQTDGRLALGSTSLPVGTTGDPVDNLNYYKWVITNNTNANAKSYSTAGSPKNISPSVATSYAWGLWSDTGRNGATVNFWDNNYQYGGAEFYKLSFSEMQSAGVPIADLKSLFLEDNTPAYNGIIGYPTSEGVTTFETTINGLSTQNTFTTDATNALNTLWSTVIYPSDGYYYIKGKAYSNYMLYDENLTNYGYAALLNDETTAKQLWKVTANGYTPTVTSSIGKPIANDSKSYDPITLSSAYVNGYTDGYGYFYFNDFHSPNSSTQANAYAYNTAAAYSNSNPMRAISYRNTSGSGNYWTFVDASSSYDIYNVVIDDPLGLSPTLTCTLDGYTGNKVVYNGGFYAFTKDTEISTSNFTAQSSDLDGYDTDETTISIADNTITVTYVPEQSYTDLVLAYFSENAIGTKLNNSRDGVLGYPTTSSDGYTDLNTFATTSKDSYDKSDYLSLVSLYSSYLAESTVNIPAANSFWRINSILSANASLKAVDGGSRMTFTTTKDKETIFLVDGGSHLISYSKGLSVNNVREMGNVGTAGSTFTFVKAVNGNLGQLSIMCNDGGDYNNTYLYSTGVDNSNADRNTQADYWNDNNSFTLEKITSLPVTISAVKYATLYSPVALTIPSGVKAYYVSALTSTEATLTEIPTTIPAETPVILYAENIDKATTYNFNITTGGTDVSSSNKLSGVIATTAFDDNEAYTLQQQYGGTAVGLFPKAAGNLAGFKAYMLASQLSAGVKGLVFSFEDVDGISQIENGELKMENAIYNIAGQRVTKPTKGLYIKNGKKVIIK